ncbi:restriction endonuclease subunit S [Bacillus sp. JJ1532]|uniref:restriction endonuclease subunit S n=1 Tax=Bacillus sp. JJ1532 TaxID=3122958 RepID=UPI0030008126
MKNNIVPLLSVCDFKGGSQPPKSEWIKEPKNGYVRMLQIRDFTQGNAEIEYVKIKEKMNFCSEKDILIARYGASIGKIVTGLSGTYNVALIKAIPDESKLSKKYLYYFLKSKTFQNFVQNVGSRAAQAGFNKEDLKSVDIYLPTLSEQEKIVELLELTNDNISKRKSQIAALDELTQSVYLEMFGDSFTNDKNYPTQLLSDIASIGSSKRVFVKELVDEGIPFYRGTEVGSLALGEDISPTLFITEEHYINLKESSGVPVIGDLLMPSICPDGRIWRVQDNKPFYFKDGRVLWIHFTTNDVNTLFIQYALKDKLIRDYSNIASGTTFAELKIFSLKNVKIMIPPLDLQNKFESIVNKIDDQKKIMAVSLQGMKDNYNSLLQKAFKGELFQE